ncbi:hypothetical protein B0H66DRAFT_542746 [Apodospora peruviana]|uniref:Uncharacterized protein n=1 Tax=Apodospora peruviana TaxID=516989 RepID=A0AAE0IRP6_9PEZI|nr:hypothetical protein B0H66DRAFT_542746 [Apodospora peruviana]
MAIVRFTNKSFGGCGGLLGRQVLGLSATTTTASISTATTRMKMRRGFVTLSLCSRLLSQQSRSSRFRLLGRGVTASSMSTSDKPAPPKTKTPAATPNTVLPPSSSTRPKVGSPQTLGKQLYPERLLIYHAGTGKTIFLATLKLTTVFAFAIFDLYAAPNFLMASAPLYQVAGIAICGIIPFSYVVYTTSPFVTTIHMHVPHFARSSAATLQKFAKSVPPTTRLDLSTLSLIGKPRVSSTTVGELRPVSKRLGMVNYERDTTKLNKDRKWWRFRPLGLFNVQKGNEKKTKTGWVWGQVVEAIAKREQQVVAGQAAVGKGQLGEPGGKVKVK